MNGFHFTDRGNATNEDFAYAGALALILCRLDDLVGKNGRKN